MGNDALPDSSLANHPFTRRIHPPDSAPLSALLAQPTAFGSVFLGQTFSFAVVISNTSNTTVSSVSIKVELQSDHSKIVIFNSTSQPLPFLAPGQRKDIVLAQEIKELGAHSLTCSTIYTSAEGDRRYYPRVFNFNAALPLTAKTKHRLLVNTLNNNNKDPSQLDILLETCIENNNTNEPMLIDKLTFLPEPGVHAMQLVMQNDNEEEGGTTTSNATHAIVNQLDHYITALPLLSSAKDSRSFVFKLSLTRSFLSSISPSPSSPQQQPTLGRLDILWRMTMGGAARLQTQPLHPPPGILPSFKSSNSSGPFKIRIVPVAIHPVSSSSSSVLTVQQPFELKVKVYNDSSSGGDHNGPAVIKGVQMSGPISHVGLSSTVTESATSNSSSSIVVDGCQTVEVGDIPAGGESGEVSLRMMALVAGPLVIRSVVLTAENGNVVVPLQPLPIFVHSL